MPICESVLMSIYFVHHHYPTDATRAALRPAPVWHTWEQHRCSCRSKSLYQLTLASHTVLIFKRKESFALKSNYNYFISHIQIIIFEQVFFTYFLIELQQRLHYIFSERENELKKETLAPFFRPPPPQAVTLSPACRRSLVPGDAHCARRGPARGRGSPRPSYKDSGNLSISWPLFAGDSAALHPF